MHVSIDKNLIPYNFEMQLANEMFKFTVNYNDRFDFFTVDIEKNGVVLVLGEKLVLNKPLFSSLSNPQLPKLYIIPLDESGEQTRITWDNLDSKIFLFIGEDI